MRMPFVVMFEGLARFLPLLTRRLRHDADVIALHRFDEALCHPVAFRLRTAVCLGSSPTILAN